MYNPISLNVIRQAIDWHTPTAPQRIKRTFQQKWPNGNITTIYDLEFIPAQVLDAMGTCSLQWDSDLNPFVELLNGCFAGDCHVIEQHYDNPKNVVRIKLYTYFDKDPNAKPRW